LGSLPLSGGTCLGNITHGQVEELSSQLTLLTDLYAELPDPVNIVSVGSALSRVVRLHPGLRSSLGHHESTLLAVTKSVEFNDQIEQTFDEEHAKRLKRWTLEFGHLYAVGKLAFDKSYSDQPDLGVALSLDLPNVAMNLLNIEMMQLCARGDYESVLMLFDTRGRWLIKKYEDYKVSRIAVSLGRVENADMHIMTCVGNMFTSVAIAHMMRAVQESGHTKRNSIKWARRFTETAKVVYRSVEPVWSHGLASLQILQYVEQTLVGNTRAARDYWRTAYNQLLWCNDLRKAEILKDVKVDDPGSLEGLLLNNF
jgi:hypothetical protein